MERKLFTGLALAIFVSGSANFACADLYNQNVTPVKSDGTLLMGTGIANGGFTVSNDQGVELGLRGRLRFDSANQPTNIINSNGDGTYRFSAGSPTGGASWVGSTTPLWNFDWSVSINNIDTLSDYYYELGLDFDPTANTTYLKFDPVRLIPDNAHEQYVPYHYAQNSGNYEFFNAVPFDTFNPNIDGTYNLYLAAWKEVDGSKQWFGRTDIQIIVGTGTPSAPVPEPTTMLLFGTGIAGLIGAARRKKLN